MQFHEILHFWSHYTKARGSDLRTFHDTICIRIDLYVQYLCYSSTNNDIADTLTFNSALLYRYMNMELPYAA
jgi:hypothetical protein